MTSVRRPDTAAHVAVMILNYRGWQDTLGCVTSLLKEGTPCRLSIVVCDNDSPDDSWPRLTAGLAGLIPPGQPGLQCLSRSEAEHTQPADVSAEPGPGVRIVLIQNGGNLGFAGGNNVGARWALAAGADYFWFLNNDTEVAPGAIGALLDRFGEQPAVGLCGSKLLYADDPTMVQARGGAGFDPARAISWHLGVGERANAAEDRHSIEQAMDYVVGASMMASRAFVERVGLMQEDYLLYYEELDWATRGRALGFALGYAQGSVVYHKEGATIGTSHRHSGSAFSMRFLSRNRLLFTRRFHPDRMGSVRRRMVFEAVVMCKRRHFAHAWAIVRALLGRPVALAQRPAGSPASAR